MKFAIASLLSLLSLLSAVPASLALPEPGSLRHNHDARELEKRAAVALVIVDKVIGRTCPSESCSESRTVTLGNQVNCDCYATDRGATTSTTRWALELSESATIVSDDDTNSSTTGTTNSSAPGITAAQEETWYPFSGLDLTPDSLPPCS